MNRYLTVAVALALFAAAGCGGGSGASTTERTQAHQGARAHVQQERLRRQSAECDPNYVGACLSPIAYDYDCEGGSGDGPEYTGTVTVVGDDHYGLDSDGDRTGCE
jgi:hypothetical protein